jgi:putative ABC transport system permease protein
MLAAMWRKLRADLLTHKLQFFLIWGILTLSAMLLTVSLLVRGSADEPWDRTFADTNGPHVWAVSPQSDLDFSPLIEDPAVTETTGALLALAENPLVLDDQKLPFLMYAMDQPPPVAHPLLADGRWLEPANPDEIVLDYSLARFYDIQVGAEVTVLAAGGTHTLHVVGLAVTAHWFPYDEITKDIAPGVGYISQATLQAIQPEAQSWYAVLGLRLKDPQSSKAFVEHIQQTFPSQMRTVLEWQWVRAKRHLRQRSQCIVHGFLQHPGPGAVGLVIFNTIGGQVLSQYQEIGFLKAAGFKPGQVTLLFLFEHLATGLLAAVLGIAAGLAVAPGLVSSLAESLNTTPPNPYAPAPLLAVLLLVEAAVALATLLPAWQGGRIDTVQAITLGYRRQHHCASLLARLARLAAWLRLPALVVLGVKDTFSRPLRATIAIAGLVLTVVLAITVVAGQTTAQALAHNRLYFNGTTADMTVERNFVPSTVIETGLLAQPDVAQYYTELPLFGQAAGHTDQPIFYRFLGGSYADFNFQIKEGRMFSAPGEAVVSYAILDLLGVQVGDTIELFVDGYPIRLTIVGRHMEFYNLGNVIVTSLETYHQQVDPQAQPTVYYLRLANPAAAADLRSQWLEESRGLLNIRVITDAPQASMVQLVGSSPAWGSSCWSWWALT